MDHEATRLGAARRSQRTATMTPQTMTAAPTIVPSNPAPLFVATIMLNPPCQSATQRMLRPVVFEKSSRPVMRTRSGSS
jgi:hypothetical protein